MNEQPREIFVRLERCMGCHSCELACAVAHSGAADLDGALACRPAPKRRLHVEWAETAGRPVPVLCRHCDQAPCMNACITGAIYQQADGTKVIDTHRCIGCWTCVMVCPYGVIGRDMAAKVAYRCDRCRHRDEPACVAACPTGALVYRTVAADAKQRRRQAADQMAVAEQQGG